MKIRRLSIRFAPTWFLGYQTFPNRLGGRMVSICLVPFVSIHFEIGGLS